LFLVYVRESEEKRERGEERARRRESEEKRERGEERARRERSRRERARGSKRVRAEKSVVNTKTWATLGHGSRI
jgi:hypothetical protein